jgi:diketogulonate reductase-like aldo/keto reductase
VSVSRYFTLSNGLKLPLPGFGTYLISGGGEAETAVKNALDAGYRHFDTAPVYANEFSIGNAINESGIDRAEIFIANKLWNTKRGYEPALKAFRQTLKRLKQEYIDLYLIHWPASKKLYEDWWKINSETWRALETLYNDGVAKAIGICNFTPDYLNPLLENAKMIPMVNQIEYHPGQTQQETRELCRKYDIRIEAWSPLGQGKLLKKPELKSVAEKYGKTTAQICLRWCFQNEAASIPKSLKPERMRENISIFDFEISPQDMAYIDNLTFLDGSGFTPDDFEMQFREQGDGNGA